MITVSRRVELTVRSASDSVSLSRLISVTGSCGVGVLAARSYWDGHETVMMLVTEDDARTARALNAAGFTCQATSVVLVSAPDQPGQAALLGAKLSTAGINVLYAYSSRSDDDRIRIVFRTSDDKQAAYLLELDDLVHDLAAAKSLRPRPVTKRVDPRFAPQAA